MDKLALSEASLGFVCKHNKGLVLHYHTADCPPLLQQAVHKPGAEHQFSERQTDVCSSSPVGSPEPY